MRPLRFILDRMAPWFGKGKPLERLYPVYEVVDTFFYTPGETAEGSCHVRDSMDYKRMMSVVLVALVPCVVMACYNTGLQAHRVLAARNATTAEAVSGGERSAAAAAAASSEIEPQTPHSASPLGWRSAVLAWLGARHDPNSLWANFVLGALYFAPVYLVTMAVGLGWEILFAVLRRHGIRRALADGADYVLLLNNDTLVAADMVSRLVAVAEADPSIGIVGPVICYHEPSDVIWNAGNAIDWQYGQVANLFGDEQAERIDGPVCAVDYVTGCALCIKEPVANQIGLLDARFFIYYEETDWCVRAREHGYRTVMVPGARIWHKVSRTMGVASPATTYYMTRNQFLFFARHTCGVARTALLARILLRELRTLAAHSLKPRYRSLRRQRDARLLALRDACLGRWGKMGPDVTQVCYPRTL